MVEVEKGRLLLKLLFPPFASLAGWLAGLGGKVCSVPRLPSSSPLTVRRFHPRALSSSAAQEFYITLKEARNLLHHPLLYPAPLCTNYGKGARKEGGGAVVYMPGTGCCRRRRPNFFCRLRPWRAGELSRIVYRSIPGNCGRPRNKRRPAGEKLPIKKFSPPPLRGSVERRRRRRLRVRFFAPLVNNLASTPLSLKI